MAAELFCGKEQMAPRVNLGGCVPQLSFTTGMKNNPDILSQKQMLHATDCAQFLGSQQPEMQGFYNVDIF